MTAAVAPRDLTAGEARDCIVRIKDSLAVAWDWVIRAYTGRAWLALGYPSWDALCDAEFDGARIRLPREERREVVATLREAGMSTRAIASATGTSYDTVQRDLRAGDRNLSGEPVTGTDGKSYAATQPLRPVSPPVPVEPETVDAEIVDEQPAGPGRQLPAEFTGWLADQGRVEKAAQRVAAHAEGRAWQEDLNRSLPSDVREEMAELDRRYGAVHEVVESCERLVRICRLVPPERVAAEAPDNVRANLAVVGEAADYLARLREAIDR